MHEKIESRFYRIGFELEAAEGGILKFTVSKWEWSLSTFDAALGVLLFGPIGVAFVLGHHWGSHGVGLKGEKLWFRLEEPTSRFIAIPRKSWWHRLTGFATNP